MTQRMTDTERANKLKDLINSWNCSADDILEALAQSRAEGFEEAISFVDCKVGASEQARDIVPKMRRALRPGGKGEVK